LLLTYKLQVLIKYRRKTAKGKIYLSKYHYYGVPTYSVLLQGGPIKIVTIVIISNYILTLTTTSAVGNILLFILYKFKKVVV
jgi:hypothetical protein